MDNPIKAVYRALLRPIYARLDAIELQMRAQANRRFTALNQLAEYLVVSEVRGDYLEFGVASGLTFAHACNLFSADPFFRDMKFFALDSFEGLPRPQGLDAAGGFTSHFYESQYACGEEEFVRNLRRSGVATERVTLVKGWFDKSLTEENAEAHGIGKVAVAWVDCDLYESTVPVLRFLTPRLSNGAVVVFDDWSCFRNSPSFGEQRACREWLEQNPQISLHEFFSFGGHGRAFTVELSEP